MTGHGNKFGRKKEQAIAALLTQRNPEEAARAVGIAPKTLKRWMRLPEFQTEYLEARREAVLQAVARIQQNCTAAASVLLKLMADTNTPASVRVRAADSVLERGVKSIELEDLALRIARLEERDQRERY
jgi:predicted TPR repeat methyltransferase